MCYPYMSLVETCSNNKTLCFKFVEKSLKKWWICSPLTEQPSVCFFHFRTEVCAVLLLISVLFWPKNYTLRKLSIRLMLFSVKSCLFVGKTNTTWERSSQILFNAAHAICIQSCSILKKLPILEKFGILFF